MRTKSGFLLLAALFLSVQMYAQREETLLGSRSWGFSGIWGGYHHQYTGFKGDDLFNRGGFFQFEFGKSLLIGWGHYRLDDRFIWPGTDQRFDFRFNVAKIGYQFMPYKAVHPHVNFDFGRGWVGLGAQPTDRVSVLQPSAGIEINVFRWFRVDLDGGYRFIRDSDTPGITNTDLSGAYASATLKFGFSWGRYHRKSSSKAPRSYEN